MGSTTGLIVFDGQPGSLSGETQAKMDREVIALVDRLYAKAKELLVQHRPALDALATALLEHETLDGPDAIRVLEAAGMERPGVRCPVPGPGSVLAGDRRASLN
jgi:cell division protease FtsH